MGTLKEIATACAFPTNSEDFDGLTKFEYFATKFTAAFIASGDGYEKAIKGGIEAAKEYMAEIQKHSF